MIQLENVSCGYGNKTVLSGVNLDIHRGDLTCLLGKNGTGKTTLFKSILGLLPLINGAIRYRDQSVREISHRDIARLISYVPQAHGTPFPYKVSDVVLMGQHIHASGFLGKPGRKNRETAMECLDTLGIEKLADKSFSRISGGEKQMVLIARAMAQEPSFIAMDEPTANLDMGNSVRVMKVARALKEKGYGVIMNTHTPEQALDYADKVVLLKDGKVFRHGTPDEILKSGTLTDLYNTPVELVDAIISNGEKRKLLVTI